MANRTGEGNREAASKKWMGKLVNLEYHENHFCRKHGEKRWPCPRCGKRYAVQAGLKAPAATAAPSSPGGTAS